MRRPFTLTLAALVLAIGCYRSHQRESHDSGLPTDAPGRADAWAEPVDAHVAPLRCDELAVSHTLALDDTTRTGVTPRLAVLPGPELGLVYVSTDGDPTRVSFERFSTTLDRLGGPTVVVSDAWTWAEPAWLGDRLAVAYGRTAREPSAISFLDARGARLSVAPVSLLHPSFVRPVGEDLLWIAIESRTDNAFLIQRIDRSGAAVSAEARIELGRYGSGHGLASLPDGAHLLGYSREGPRGVRQVYLRRVEQSGTLGDELQLSDRGDAYALPASSGDDVVVVYGGDTLTLAELDPRGTDLLRTEEAPIEARAVVPAFAGDRVVVSTTGSEGFVLHDFGRSDDEGFVRLAPIAVPGSPQFADAVSLPGAAVFAIHVVRGGTETFPFLVRVECRSRASP